LTSALTALKTTRKTFKLPLESPEHARTAVQTAVAVEIRAHGGTPAKNAEFDRITGEIAEWLLTQRTPWIVMCGQVGNGKTTFMDAITSLYTLGGFTYKGVCAGFRKVEACDIDHLARTERIQELKECPMLAIDDLGCEAARVSVFGNEVSPVTEILQHRYTGRMLTMFTTNLTPRQIGERYGDRIADRFRESATFVRFNEASYRKGGAR